MQTIYYKTKNFIRHEGNVVNLQEYRTRLQACSGFDAPPVRREEAAGESQVLFLEEHGGRTAINSAECKSAARKERLSLRCLPDLCATVAIIVMAMTVIIRFLQF